MLKKKKYEVDLDRTTNLVVLRVICINPPEHRKGVTSLYAKGEVIANQRSFGIAIKSFGNEPDIMHIKENDRFLAIGSLDVFPNYKTGKISLSLNVLEIYDIEYIKLKKGETNEDSETSRN